MTASVAVLVLKNAGEPQDCTIESSPLGAVISPKIDKRLRNGPRFGRSVVVHFCVSHKSRRLFRLCATWTPFRYKPSTSHCLPKSITENDCSRGPAFTGILGGGRDSEKLKRCERASP